MQLPGFLLTETVTVEPYSGTAGPAFGTAETVRAHVQEGRKLVRADAGYDSEATLNVFLRLGPTIPAGSRVTVRGRTTTVLTVDVNDGRGLPTPDHIELWCEDTAFVASTTVTVTRGTPTADSFGDLVDATTVVATALPASIIESSQRRYEPAEQRGGVVETFTFRLRSTADIREGDRLTDDRTARVYQALAVAYPHTTVGPALGTDDVRVTARRVATTSLPNT